MRIRLESIELDTSIQCRAAIDTAVVNEYAERMSEGDEFPPVELYGTTEKCWPADGWHRIMAARQNSETAIDANLHAGGRVDALKAALSANAIHGHRRSPADKRRAVEIALAEFSELPSRDLAELCQVSHWLVQQVRPGQLEDSSNSHVTGRDGKQYPARRPRNRAAKTEKKPMSQSLQDRFAQAAPGVSFNALKKLPRKDDAEVVDRVMVTLAGVVSGLAQIDMPALASHDYAAMWRQQFTDTARALRVAARELSNTQEEPQA